MGVEADFHFAGCAGDGVDEVGCRGRCQNADGVGQSDAICAEGAGLAGDKQQEFAIGA